MKKVIINENQRGLLFKDGKFQNMLAPGKYCFFGKNKEVEICDINNPLSSNRCPVEVLLKDKEIAENTDVFELKDGQLGLCFKNGTFSRVIRLDKQVLWNINCENEVMIVDLSDPKVGNDIPKYIFPRLSSLYYQQIAVAEYETCMLFYDGKFAGLLEPGKHYFWKTNTAVTYKTFDMRLTNMSVSGQEVLTLDKVTIRVNLTVNYKLKDPVKMFSEIGDCTEQLHIAAQMSLRDYVGKYKLDEILTSKDEMSKFVLECFKEKEKELYIEVTDAGVKDIILPGEIRDIMNTVLVAEKRAQASVITRREEVASTRSLLNTAKLMDENKTLYKLKELEYVEKICENVGSISLNGSGDILSQLTGLMRQTNT